MKAETSPLLHEVADCRALAEALAWSIAERLAQAVAARGRASLALSGGRTPTRFLQVLAQQTLDWKRVTVTLADERWVPESHERSNARLLRAFFLHGPAAAANFLPLTTDDATPGAGLAAIEARLAEVLLSFDVAVLGMGDDGHTATWFPGDDRLAKALDPCCPNRGLPMHAPGVEEPRITFTAPVLLNARNIYLHIDGQASAGARPGGGAGGRNAGPGCFARGARAAHRVLVSINFKSLRGSRPCFMRRSPR
jgi:6-phosphogluconolactonase